MRVVEHSNLNRVYHVEDGIPTQIHSSNENYTPGGWKFHFVLASRKAHDQVTLTDGWPSGRWGVIGNKVGNRLDYLRLWPQAEARSTMGRWVNWGLNSGLNIDQSVDRLVATQTQLTRVSPILLKGLRVKRFQVTFSMRRITSGGFEKARR
jgi:hypothetical protein